MSAAQELNISDISSTFFVSKWERLSVESFSQLANMEDIVVTAEVLKLERSSVERFPQ